MLTNYEKSADLPYVIHTGRELELMLIGVKPLAVFYDSYPEDPCEEIIPENAFTPHVEAGSFEKREFVELLDKATAGYTQPCKGTSLRNLCDT